MGIDIHLPEQAVTISIQSKKLLQLLDCRVCHEHFTATGVRQPRVLHGCGHSICQQCMLHLLQANMVPSAHYGATGLSNLSISCPLDRLPSTLVHEPTTGTLGLRKNFALVELLEMLQIQSSNQQSTSNTTTTNTESTVRNLGETSVRQQQQQQQQLYMPTTTTTTTMGHISQGSPSHGAVVVTMEEQATHINQTPPSVQSSDQSAPSHSSSSNGIAGGPGQPMQQPHRRLNSGTQLSASGNADEDTAASGTASETNDNALNENQLNEQRELGVTCDESSEHTAVVYCTVCESNLCAVCSQQTHNTRVLSRHRRVPLTHKQHQRQKCPFHCAYALEFVCKEPNCASPNRLMCLLCRDYGRHQSHKHALLEAEAQTIRTRCGSTLQDLRRFNNDLREWSCRVARLLLAIESTDGSLNTARHNVRVYFDELRDQLMQQEQAALNVVESHARERILTLAQTQQDLDALAAQISAVCTQLEQNVKLEDARLLSQQEDMVTLLDVVNKQRLEFVEMPAVLHDDARIPLMFTKDNRVHIGPNVEMRVVVLGLDGAGKTTILSKLKQNEIGNSVPTIGFNVETLEYRNLKLTLWDVGGMPKLRPLWKHYYLNTQAVLFVIDSTDSERFLEAQSEFVKLLSENELREAVMLILANKQDMPAAESGGHLQHHLNLHKLCYGRVWQLIECDAVSGRGLPDALNWLAQILLSHNTHSNTTVHSRHSSPPSTSQGAVGAACSSNWQQI